MTFAAPFPVLMRPAIGGVGFWPLDSVSGVSGTGAVRRAKALPCGSSTPMWRVFNDTNQAIGLAHKGCQGWLGRVSDNRR